MLETPKISSNLRTEPHQFQCNHNPLSESSQPGASGYVRWSYRCTDLSRSSVYHVLSHCYHRIWQGKWRSKRKASFSEIKSNNELENYKITGSLGRNSFLTCHLCCVWSVNTVLGRCCTFVHVEWAQSCEKIEVCNISLVLVCNSASIISHPSVATLVCLVRK